MALDATASWFGSPMSDMTTRFAPFGATTRASTSFAVEWVRPWKVTVTLLTVPVMPLTAMPDG